MPRPRKPTASLELVGAFAKNPKRRRKDAKTKGPIGDPPPSLPLQFHAVWFELIDAAPLDILTHADRPFLASFCRWTHRERTAEKWTAADAAALAWFYVRAGMTPVDRSRVHSTGEKAANPFAKFARKSHGARKPH
jgi:hypothetical protein